MVRMYVLLLRVFGPEDLKSIPWRGCTDRVDCAQHGAATRDRVLKKAGEPVKPHEVTNTASFNMMIGKVEQLLQYNALLVALWLYSLLTQPHARGMAPTR